MNSVFRRFFSICAFLFLMAFANFVEAQDNSISGFVSNNEKSFLVDINVELMDDLNRTVARTRTDGSGRYTFLRLAAGTYRVKVLPSGTNLAEQIQQVEITTFTGRSSDNQRIQLDFIMKPRKENIVGIPSAIYVQEVPENAKRLYEEAILAINKKNTDEGIRLLNESLKAFPDYVLALSKLGYEYARLQKYELAVDTFKKAVTINQKDFTNWYTLGFCYVSMKKPGESLEAIEKAINISPSSIDALLLYGIALRQSGKFEDAEKQLLNAKKFSKNKNPDVHWHLALLYAYNLKKYALAADELELYLKSQPDAKDSEGIKKLIEQYRKK